MRRALRDLQQDEPQRPPRKLVFDPVVFSLMFMVWTASMLLFGFALGVVTL